MSNILAIVPSIGAPELIIILIILLLVFGGTKLPKLARSLGQAQKEFKDGLSENSEGDASEGTSGAASSDQSRGGSPGKNGSG